MLKISKFKIREEMLNSSDTKESAMEDVNEFCKHLKTIFGEVVDDFKTKVEKHVESVCQKASGLKQKVQVIEEELNVCQQGPEFYVPISKLANVHGGIVDLDKEMVGLTNDLKISNVNLSNAFDTARIRNSCQLLLKDFCGLQLSTKIFPTAEAEHDYEDVHKCDYIPEFLQTLRQAVEENDVEAFKGIIENPNMPANAKKFILNYRFDVDIEVPVLEGQIIKNGRDEVICRENVVEKYSLFMLACKKGSLNIVQYLIQLDPMDIENRLAAKQGIDAFNFLLNVDIISNEREKLIEKLLDMAPKMMDTKSSVDIILALVLLSDSGYLCRLMVTKYGIELNRIVNNITPLSFVIKHQCKNSFDQLLSLGALPLVLECVDFAYVKEICKQDWSEAVYSIISKLSQESWKINDLDSNRFWLFVLESVLDNDAVNTFETIYMCVEKGLLPQEYISKSKLKENAEASQKAAGIKVWLQEESVCQSPKAANTS